MASNSPPPATADWVTQARRCEFSKLWRTGQNGALFPLTVSNGIPPHDPGRYLAGAFNNGRKFAMRALSWCLSLWLRAFARRPARAKHITRLRAECLEARQLLTITIQFDYRQDANHFFDDPARQQILELAGQSLGSRLNDHLQAITPSGSNTWTLSVTNPSGASSFSLTDVTIPENTLLVFVGARAMSPLGIGGPGAYSASGSTEWLDLVESRGQAGALNNPQTDFSPWGGSISFDLDANWYFGTSEAGLGSGRQDFLSVATHELGHLLGIGTADSWDRYVSGESFVGPNARAVHGGNVPLSGDATFVKVCEMAGRKSRWTPRCWKGHENFLLNLILPRSRTSAGK